MAVAIRWLSVAVGSWPRSPIDGTLIHNFFYELFFRRSSGTSRGWSLEVSQTKQLRKCLLDGVGDGHAGELIGERSGLLAQVGPKGTDKDEILWSGIRI